MVRKKVVILQNGLK
jgi:Tetratricopeptide repeat